MVVANVVSKFSPLTYKPKIDYMYCVIINILHSGAVTEVYAYLVGSNELA